MAKFKKIAIMVVSGIVILFIGSAMGSSGAKITLNEQKVDSVALEKAIKKLKSEKKDAQAELDKQKEKNKEVFALIDKKFEIQKKVTDVTSELDSKRTELNSTNAKLDKAQKELASVSGQVKKAKGSPKTLQAGQYIVGKDIPEGRYKATPVGEGSNFQVFNDEGTADVNTILGSYGEPSYTFFTMEGQIIKTEATVKLTPVE